MSIVWQRPAGHPKTPSFQAPDWTGPDRTGPKPVRDRDTFFRIFRVESGRGKRLGYGACTAWSGAKHLAPQDSMMWAYSDFRIRTFPRIHHNTHTRMNIRPMIFIIMIQKFSTYENVLISERFRKKI